MSGGAELLAEVPNDVDVVASSVVCRPPDVREEVHSGDWRAPAGGQCAEDAELARRQLHPRPVDVDRPVAVVEEWFMRDAELRGGDAVEPPVD